MAKQRTLPSQDFLDQCLSYDPETGGLIWRHRPAEHFVGSCKRTPVNRQILWNSRFAGKAGWRYGK